MTESMAGSAKRRLIATFVAGGLLAAIAAGVLAIYMGVYNFDKLPELTPEQYQMLVKSAPTHDEMMQEMEGGHMDHQGH